MVAWRIILATPEYPDGREIILIANDMTYLIGSFGPKEYAIFNKASILARDRRVPRVNIIGHLILILLKLCIFIDLHCL